MKYFLAICILVCTGYCLHAQVHPHALGLRLGGDGDINGAEISYQHATGPSNRYEFDLGFGGNSNHNRTFITGIYHWNWHISGGLNWYAGPGASLGIYSFDDADSYVNIGVGGQVGLEYDFNRMDAPILVSLDTRPMWDLVGDISGLGWGIALGIRYTW